MSLSRLFSVSPLQRIYKAIRADDAIALEKAVKDAGIGINQTITVYDSTYEPVSTSLFNSLRKITTKTMLQMAADMGHTGCIIWLLKNDADIRPVIKDSAENPDQRAKQLGRFIDDKTNYKSTALMMISAMDQLKPEDIKELLGDADNHEASKPR